MALILYFIFRSFCPKFHILRIRIILKRPMNIGIYNSSEKIVQYFTMKVYVGLSGGIDSAVSAYLLKKDGFEVVGAFFKLENEEHLSRCCDITNAQRISKILKIPFVEIDVSEEFNQSVKHYFLESLQTGLTPNPCTVCNEKIKFGIGFEKLKKLFGGGLFATGHYAVREDAHLKKGIDPIKDQSYMLWRLKKAELVNYIFPLGTYLKSDVINLGLSLDLPVAKESEDLCFIQGDIKDFIRAHLSEKEGNIVDKSGKVLGKHKGIYFYTIGQRSGLGISYKEPLYVIDTDPINNLVIVSTFENCFFKSAELAEVNQLEDVSKDKLYKAKIRYQSSFADCYVKENDGSVSVEFTTPQFAITKGQSIVVYNNDTVVLGGVIKEAKK